MTPELQQRLEQSLAPFDGACIHNADDLTLSQLRQLLKFAITWLKSRVQLFAAFATGMSMTDMSSNQFPLTGIA